MREVRTIAARYTVPTDGGRTLTGYAAVWDSPAAITDYWGTFTEVVKRGAFARTLAAGGDVLCCLNHSADRLLGRTASGTATFAEDATGLAFRVELADTRDGNEVLTMVRRGDLNGASFAFRCAAGGDHWTSPYDRELVDLDLYEAGPVVTPAYVAGRLGG